MFGPDNRFHIKTEKGFQIIDSNSKYHMKGSSILAGMCLDLSETQSY